MSASLYLLPVGGAFVAWAWLEETPSPLGLVGGALAVAGVALTTVPTRTTAT
jgi:drug/metabolite transporter (DMT)-like permease